MVALELILSGLLIVAPEGPDTNNSRQFDKVEVYMVEAGAMHRHDPQLLIPRQYIADVASLPTFCNGAVDPVVCDVSGKAVELQGLETGNVTLKGDLDLCSGDSSWEDFCYVLPINHVPYTPGPANPKVEGLDKSKVPDHTSSTFTLESGVLSSAHCPKARKVKFAAGSPHQQYLAEHARLRVEVTEASVRLSERDGNVSVEIQLKDDSGAISLAYYNKAPDSTSAPHFGAFFALLKHGFGRPLMLDEVENGRSCIPEGDPSLLPSWFLGRVCGPFAANGTLCPLIRADPVTGG